jgi:hypothetical protein
MRKSYYLKYNILTCYSESADSKAPRLNVALPGPAPYSVPASHSTGSNTFTSPQVMGPPPIRLQTGLYPPQPQIGSLPRPILSSAPIYPLAPPVVPEDRPQDAEQLQDALASAGVDLKAEEYNLSQISTPNSSTAPQPFVFSPTYIPGQQLEDSKLIFNRPILSRFVDRIGISLRKLH